MRLSTLLATLALAASGCALHAPIRGAVQGSDERFAGVATGDWGGNGTLEVTSTRGVRCSGTFLRSTGRFGQGVFTCDDGRTGPFTFVTTGTRGTGSGDLGGQRFTFVIGD